MQALKLLKYVGLVLFGVGTPAMANAAGAQEPQNVVLQQRDARIGSADGQSVCHVELSHAQCYNRGAQALWCNVDGCTAGRGYVDAAELAFRNWRPENPGVEIMYSGHGFSCRPGGTSIACFVGDQERGFIDRNNVLTYGANGGLEQNNP